MGIRTGVPKFAFAIHFPVSAHLRLLFEGILLLELDSLLGSLKVLFLSLSCCLAKVCSLISVKTLGFEGSVELKARW